MVWRTLLGDALRGCEKVGGVEEHIEVTVGREGRLVKILCTESSLGHKGASL